MDLGLAGRRALVTGGSRGMGRAIAQALAAEGASVALCARDGAAAQEAAAAIAAATGARVVAFQADTGSAEDVERLVAESVAALGGLDILVNNAARVGGTGGPDTLAQLNVAMIEEDVRVKVLGYLRVAQAAYPHMEAGGWGRIVNMDGMAARNAAGISGGLRNAAVMNFTKVMSEELGPKGITVNAVHPAVTRTAGLINRLEGIAKARGISMEEAEAGIAAGNAIKRLVDETEVANVVAFLCSEQAGCITGEAVAAAGGNSRSVFY
jgi:NAD(P)-dependent dehydrogenase (short-subunit alcohol dehydrogenase family)